MLALPRRVPDGFIRPRGVGSLFFFLQPEICVAWTRPKMLGKCPSLLTRLILFDARWHHARRCGRSEFAFLVRRV